MKIAFCIFKYHPFGGLQRDFLRIAKTCAARGHAVTVFCHDWAGERPEGLAITLIAVTRLANHDRIRQFAERVKPKLAGFDCVVGFNRMPYLDVFFAGESCYVAGIARKKSIWFRLTRRYRVYKKMEEGVYGDHSQTQALLLSKAEETRLLPYYPNCASRLTILPPGIEQSRWPADNHAAIRQQLRQALQIKKHMVLMIGSDFKRKGVDRAIQALAALPDALKSQTQLCILGKGKVAPYAKLANALSVTDQVTFLGPKDNAPEYLFAADLLLHPAREETAGMVLIEAIAAHCPLLISGTCGYADIVTASGGGVVCKDPFEQTELNAQLTHLLQHSLNPYQEKLTQYTQQHDLFGLEKAVVDFIEQQGRS